MKKTLLAVISALSISGLCFAQDGYYQDAGYGAPAPEQPYQQPAPQPAYQEQQPVYQQPYQQQYQQPAYNEPAPQQSVGGQFLGVGLGITSLDAANKLDPLVTATLVFKVNPSIAITALLGLYHHGETTKEYNGQEQKDGDDYTQLAIGAGFDYYFMPIFSLGGEVVYNSLNKDDSRIDFNVLPGVHAEITPSLVVTGKAGLSINYYSGKEGDADKTRLDVGLAYRIYLTWFVM